jgi:hypothetical protein
MAVLVLNGLLAPGRITPGAAAVVVITDHRVLEAMVVAALV